MWQHYEASVIELMSAHMRSIESVQHLPPEDNYVWLVQANDRRYIVKIEPERPYRLKREIRAYDHLHGHGLPIPRVIGSGAIHDMPYLVLTFNGSRTARIDFNVRAKPADTGLITSILDGLLRFSNLDAEPFLYIKENVTTHDRDLERLEYVRHLPFLENTHKPLLARIESCFIRQHSKLSHRDFSPRQVVLEGMTPTLIDFESMGPGVLERDIGDFLGGILKFGLYYTQYGKAVKMFSDVNELDHNLIADFAVYSVLWSITNSTPHQVSNSRKQMVRELLAMQDWLTNACTWMLG